MSSVTQIQSNELSRIDRSETIVPLKMPLQGNRMLRLTQEQQIPTEIIDNLKPSQVLIDQLDEIAPNPEQIVNRMFNAVFGKLSQLVDRLTNMINTLGETGCPNHKPGDINIDSPLLQQPNRVINYLTGLLGTVKENFADIIKTGNSGASVSSMLRKGFLGENLRPRLGLWQTFLRLDGII